MDEKFKRMNLTLVVGARPNFMKISPLIKAIENANLNGEEISYRLIHTGQHFDKVMSDDFFEQLNIPKPNKNLNCSIGSQTEQTSCIMVEFEKELLENKPDIVIVVGDVNSTMACSIVTKKLNIKLAHIEAGIRSFDRSMPEEINRLITDSICDYYFTTSEFANQNLLKENVNKENIFFVGNTMIDCLINNLKKINPPEIYQKNKLSNKKYFLLTLHRPSNVDSVEKLKMLLQSIDNFVLDNRVIFTIHPRTKKMLDKININLKNIIITEPQKYLEFIFLLKNSLGVITDSGGITEESTFLKVPCITLRNSTERPETVTQGSNILVGDDMSLLEKNINKIIKNQWKDGTIPSLWDGETSNRIVKELLKLYKN